MARTIYEVTPSGDDWAVKKRGGSILKTFKRKLDAIAHGRAVALADQPSQLIIRKRDGSFETEHTATILIRPADDVEGSRSFIRPAALRA